MFRAERGWSPRARARPGRPRGGGANASVGRRAPAGAGSGGPRAPRRARRAARSRGPGRATQVGDPGRADRLGASQQVIADEPHRQGAGVPAARDQPAPAAARRSVAIDVAPLRVELAREVHDLPLGHRHRPERDRLPGVKVGEPHQYVSKCRRPWARSRTQRGSQGSPPVVAMVSSASSTPDSMPRRPQT